MIQKQQVFILLTAYAKNCFLYLAGKYVKSGKLPKIIDLDPAGPLFSVDKPNERLDRDDANAESICSPVPFYARACASIEELDGGECQANELPMGGEPGN
ncbi:uncharacterized protein LOC129570306 [Sitodiplosis mosellana]|uniref:uncharacterized protein LOC129570306 n=1 Tax=Sitodiplosis mosellana TaxID=263140 RepID=UPI0024451EFB|nr:uncharacterized protein LOC129570306 [Sitodiplosis mosellana]